MDASKIKDDKIEIDINVYVNDPTSETPPSNSHGPVSTYRTPEATTGYNMEVGDRPAADDYGVPPTEDYSGPQKFDDILFAYVFGCLIDNYFLIFCLLNPKKY